MFRPGDTVARLARDAPTLRRPDLADACDSRTAFHPTDGWVNPDVIGINLGITLLAAENLLNRTRVGLVHEEPGNHDGARQGGSEIARVSRVHSAHASPYRVTWYHFHPAINYHWRHRDYGVGCHRRRGRELGRDREEARHDSAGGMRRGDLAARLASSTSAALSCTSRARVRGLRRSSSKLRSGVFRQLVARPAGSRPADTASAATTERDSDGAAPARCRVPRAAHSGRTSRPARARRRCSTLSPGRAPRSAAS